MLATLSSASLLGVEGHPVKVEVHVGPGLPSFSIVGLPDTICREARDRIRAAVLNAVNHYIAHKVTVNLAPSGIRKGGAGLDLAMAVGTLVADEKYPFEASAVQGMAFLGELGLDGSIRKVPGMLPMIDAITDETVVIPSTAVTEARLVGRHRILAVSHLAQLVAVLKGDRAWPDLPRVASTDEVAPALDLSDIRGHVLARKALEISAAGGHHLLLIGPPGSGKTMLAKRLPGLLPPLEHHVAIAATRIHSAAGVELPPSGLIARAPFRAPHHGASSVAMVGGGAAWLQPGEISLAHGGVLFLDELGEYPSDVLDSLRTPLEEGVVRIARAQYRVTFPARFLLIAAMNPCPCGEAGRPGACRCSPGAVLRYSRRLSGPLVDRFDLRVQVTRPEPSELIGGEPGESTAAVAARVAAARERAWARGVDANAELASARLDEVAPLASCAVRTLETALARNDLSARGLQRVRSVALTIADLEGSEPPLVAAQISTAMRFRIDLASYYRRVAG